VNVKVIWTGVRTIIVDMEKQ